ncbi:MAG TPA: hypothetical protein VKX16_17915 [Chloroflexota bacterium]|nr:hypothetical protein [Chloroflexota bacterium]
MADSALMIGWGSSVGGRAREALRVFEEAVRYWSSLQQSGQIDGFEAFALEPHGGDLAGFALLRGDVTRLSRVRYSDEFIRLNARAALVVQNFGVVMAFTGDELTRQFRTFGEQAADLS